MLRQLLPACIALLLISCQKETGGVIIQKFFPSQGQPGDTVAIRGKSFGFSPANANIYFNGTKAVVTYVTDTLIVAVVPQNATSGKISLSLGGHTAISADDFIIYPGTWIQKADFPAAARKNAAGFSIDGKGYLGTGYDGTTQLNDWWLYDPAANSWTQKTNAPVKVELAVSMVINGKGYMGIGKTDAGNVNDFWQYDAADTWTTKAKLPGTKRVGAVGFGVGDKGYAGTGQFNGQFLKDWWQYDPSTDNWTRKADFPGDARTRGSGFVIDNKIYFGLGDGKTDWWQYDTATDGWTRKADFPGSTYDAKGITVAGKGYIAGGGNECWEYDAATDHWTRNAFFNYRLSSVAFATEDKAYYGTGSNLQGALQKDFWEFSPVQ